MKKKLTRSELNHVKIGCLGKKIRLSPTNGFTVALKRILEVQSEINSRSDEDAIFENLALQELRKINNA